MDLLSNVLQWFRYIDDVLMLWAGPIEALDQFMEMLSLNSYNLKFTMQSSLNTIAYLVITISIGTDGIINTSLYCTPTAGNTILFELILFASTFFDPKHSLWPIPMVAAELLQ